MSRWGKFEVLLIASCLAINGFMYMATAGHPERAATARKTPAPEGYRYLNSCDGRPTDRLAKIDAGKASGCLADYPGEFARGVALGFSVIFFLLAHCVFWAWGRRKKNERASPPPEEEGA